MKIWNIKIVTVWRCRNWDPVDTVLYTFYIKLFKREQTSKPFGWNTPLSVWFSLSNLWICLFEPKSHRTPSDNISSSVGLKVARFFVYWLDSVGVRVNSFCAVAISYTWNRHIPITKLHSKCMNEGVTTLWMKRTHYKNLTL